MLDGFSKGRCNVRIPDATYKTLHRNSFCFTFFWLHFAYIKEASLTLSKREAVQDTLVIEYIVTVRIVHFSKCLFKVSDLRVLWKCRSSRPLSSESHISSHIFSQSSRMSPVICRVSTLFRSPDRAYTRSLYFNYIS